MNMLRIPGPSYLRLLACSFLLCSASGQARADLVPPDSSSSDDDNPAFTFLEKGPANAPIYVWPTNGGVRIQNLDGKEVEYGAVVPPGSGTVSFTLPGIVNGLPVTDVQQKTAKPGDPLDPGTLQASVFTNGIMTTNSLGKWLGDNGYGPANGLVMPDFFPHAGSGLTDVYYGVDMATLGGAGSTFTGSHAFGDTITLTGVGTFAALPGYLFSSTPLTYTPGSGWTTNNPLPAGTELDYIAYHTARSVPEPSGLVLAGAGGLALIVGRKRLRL
jgi:hypothetical protein